MTKQTTRFTAVVLLLLLSTTAASREHRPKSKGAALQAMQKTAKPEQPVKETAAPVPRGQPVSAEDALISSAGDASDADLARLTDDIRGLFSFNGSQAPADDVDVDSKEVMASLPVEPAPPVRAAKAHAAAVPLAEASVKPQHKATAPQKPTAHAVKPVEVTVRQESVAPVAKQAEAAVLPQHKASTRQKPAAPGVKQVEAKPLARKPTIADTAVQLLKAAETTPVPKKLALKVPRPGAEVSHGSESKATNSSHAALKAFNVSKMTEKAVEALPMAKLVLDEDGSDKDDSRSNTTRNASSEPAANVSAAPVVNASTADNTSVATSAPMMSAAVVGNTSEAARSKHEHELEAEVERLRAKLAVTKEEKSPTKAAAAPPADKTAAKEERSPSKAAVGAPQVHHPAGAAAPPPEGPATSGARGQPREEPRPQLATATSHARPQNEQPLERRRDEPPAEPPQPATARRHVPADLALRRPPTTRSMDETVASLPLSGLVALDSAVTGDKEVPAKSPSVEPTTQPPAASAVRAWAPVTPQAKAPAQPAPTAAPHFSWFWSVVNWLTGGGRSPASAQSPPLLAAGQTTSLTQGPFPLLESAPPEQRKRDSSEELAEITAKQTREDGVRIVSIGDPWGALAREDEQQEERLRGEDRSLRVMAETPTAPKHDPAASTAHGGARVSSFWGVLEKEDADIEDSLQDGRDLSRYEQLTHLQDAQVGNAVAQLTQEATPLSDRPPLRRQDYSIGARTIHDPWAALEAKDIDREARVHADPELRMLQEDTHLRRRPVAAAAR